MFGILWAAQPCTRRNNAFVLNHRTFPPTIYVPSIHRPINRPPVKIGGGCLFHRFVFHGRSTCTARSLLHQTWKSTTTRDPSRNLWKAHWYKVIKGAILSLLKTWQPPASTYILPRWTERMSRLFVVVADSSWASSWRKNGSGSRQIQQYVKEESRYGFNEICPDAARI